MAHEADDGFEGAKPKQSCTIDGGDRPRLTTGTSNLYIDVMSRGRQFK